MARCDVWPCRGGRTGRDSGRRAPVPELRIAIAMPLIYAFDHPHETPPMDLKDLLGGQGGQPGRDDLGAAPAGAARLHHHHRGLPPASAHRRVARRARRRDRRAAEPHRAGDGPAAGRPRRSAAGERAVRGQVLDAGHDGHRPEPGPQRRVGAGPGRPDRQRAVRPRLVPPVRGHVRTHRPRRRRHPVRPSARRRQAPGRGDRRRRDPHRAAALPGAALPAGGAGRDRRAVPPGPDPPAAHGGRGRVPLLGRGPGRRLPDP